MALVIKLRDGLLEVRPHRARVDVRLRGWRFAGVAARAWRLSLRWFFRRRRLASPPRPHAGSSRYVRLVHLRDRGLSLALTARGASGLGACCTATGWTRPARRSPNRSSGSRRAPSQAGRRAAQVRGSVTYHVLLDRRVGFCEVGREPPGVPTTPEGSPRDRSLPLTEQLRGDAQRLTRERGQRTPASAHPERAPS